MERRRAFAWIAMVVTVLVLIPGLLVAGFFLFGAGTVRAEEPAALISALQAHLASQGMSKVPQHRYALVDLNGDSMLDAAALTVYLSTTIDISNS